MPELPEVETIRRDLSRKILSLPICEIKVFEPKTVRQDAGNFVSSLLHNHIVEIGRRGKLLYFSLKKGGVHLLAHLKMTGQLIYRANGRLTAGGHTFPPIDESLPGRHTRAQISFDGGGDLFFNDMRKFGYLDLVDDDRLSVVLSRYGVEPLTSNFTFENLMGALARRKVSLKAALLDQESVAGLGNIYVDEACFLAGVRPERAANSLSLDEIKNLHHSIESIITEAVESRGTTFNNYVDADGKTGNYAAKLKVYGRGAEPCLFCGKALRKIRLAGRGTVFCFSCQK